MEERQVEEWNDMENTEEKVSWIVKRYGKCWRKVGWFVKWYGKFGKKVVKRLGK
jgi:hypothetical protein